MSGEGRTSHIAVSQKLDMLGIGAAQQRDPNGLAWKQNRDFEMLLQRLNQNTEQASKERDKSPASPRDDLECDTNKKRRRSLEKEKKLKKAKIVSEETPTPLTPEIDSASTSMPKKSIGRHRACVIYGFLLFKVLIIP
jgi:Pin2-interacting protein X1